MLERFMRTESKDERVEGSSTDKAKHVADQAGDQAG